MPILFLSNWFTIIVFLKSICREKNHMAILLYFSTEYLLSAKHRKLNFTKKLRNFSHAFYTGLIRFVRYDTFLIYAIQYVFQTIRYVSYKIRYGSWQIRSFLIRRSSYVFRYISGIQSLQIYTIKICFKNY